MKEKGKGKKAFVGITIEDTKAGAHALFTPFDPMENGLKAQKKFKRL